ncbi:hypothetical protein F5Y12DRAFT_757664 [Xylaria sp. FL1777]|nr:hypothetical protein F5Y12DRAFT_757664 [Xylaria sp. FL1777]
MADNPHGYGHYISHYSPRPPLFPPISSSSSTQPPYSYPTPRAGAMPPATYTASQSAYDHNSNRIPGLGLGGSQMPLPTSFSPSAPLPWPAQGHNPQTNTLFQSRQPPPASLKPQQPHPAYQQSHNPLEEGELSEGEFEDLYEPKGLADDPQGARQVAPQNKPSRPSDNLDSRNGSIGDADVDGSSIYDPHDPHVIQDEGVQATPTNLSGVEQEDPPDDDWEPSYPDRERSGSYSPYLSPREVHRKVSLAKVAARETQDTDRVQSSQSMHQTGVPLPATSSTALLPNGTTLVTSGTNSNPVLTSASEHGPHFSGSLLLRSPLEAKKKAQEAILGLWPLKVRYQDYIDEGVDPTVVKALFKDLGLDVPIAKTITAPSNTMSDAQSIPAKATPTSELSHKPQSLRTRKMQVPPLDPKQPDNKDEKSKGSDNKVAEKSAAEERKDKIARKLAAMAQKTTTAQPPAHDALVPTSASVPGPTPAPVPISATSLASAPAAVPAPVPASIPAPAPASVPAPVPASASIGVVASVGTKSDAISMPLAVPKTRAENNAILQQKLAALKKQQAQLAADKARAASNESTTTSSPAAADSNSLDIDRNGDSTPKERSTVSTQQSSNQQNSPHEPQGNPIEEGIPGLSFSSLAFYQPSVGSARSLKRPVASDFDNYTPRLESLKRTRTDERLVIDVSDDEDVEMDIGSPTDELPPSLDSSTTPARQAPSSFPPLSDGPNRRQRESPASSSAPTPPVRGARIDLLHKRIEETKRLIAEAEAKKAAKKATTQLSPQPSSPAPLQPVSLPKVNENKAKDNRAINQRRDRIASYELPRVTATLKEKQDRLRLIVAEAARLELEVQASLDEEHKLKTEMEYLVDPSTRISPEPDEQRPQSTDASPHPAPVIASDGQPNAQEERLVEPQLSHNLQSSLPGANGDVDTELNNDEALQAAIFIDNTHATDIQMADAELPTSATAAADNSPVVSETKLGDASPLSLEIGGPAQPFVAEAEQETEQDGSADIDIEAESISESALPAASKPSSEPDDGSSESDVSMQQSAPELSQSDDEPYEPTSAEISNSHGIQKDRHNSAEVVDDVLEEPNPNHISIDRNHQESENTSNEVKNRSCEEPLLLTTSQDVQNNQAPLEDLLSYKSPLSYFRAYRFHPKYFEEVSGGLKSMTFSAKIDPMREVCPQVLIGEPCPKGSNCEYQHFDSMVLPDAEIITQLGSADMFVGETRTRFIEGLKRVLNELKANRVKDFDRITKAIVKHRQDFLGDKTKVLALDSSATQVTS